MCLQFCGEVRAIGHEPCGAGRVEVEASTSTATAIERRLAYVAQLASLPDVLREQLIAASGVGGFQREEEIKAFVYSAAPNRFGIMRYLHYRRSENGDAYLQGILGKK